MSAVRKLQSPPTLRPINTMDWAPSNADLARTEWVNVNDILVEHYQREIKEYKLRRMLREWDPSIAGYIILSLRENGLLYVVDGQHRTEAIRRLQHRIGPYIKAVVVEGWSADDESNFFYKSQRPENRAALMPEDIHRAAVYAGDQDAIAIQRIVEHAGFRIGRAAPNTDATKINAVKSINTVYGKYGLGILAQSLDLIVSCWGASESPEHALIEGTALFFVLFPQANTPSLAKRVGKTPQKEWVTFAKANARNQRLTMTEGVASSLRSDYNRSNHAKPLLNFEDTLREHRFTMRSQASAEANRARKARG